MKGKQQLRDRIKKKRKQRVRDEVMNKAFKSEEENRRGCVN